MTERNRDVWVLQDTWGGAVYGIFTSRRTAETALEHAELHGKHTLYVVRLPLSSHLVPWRRWFHAWTSSPASLTARDRKMIERYGV